MLVSHHYPERPKSVPLEILKPSQAFRKEAIRVVISVIGFIITYFALVAAAITLAFLCVLIGYWVMSYVKNIWVGAFGIGLIGFGVMVVYFLLKFIFNKKVVDLSSMVELTEKDQPVLFEFLRKLAKETETPLPKHVYVSPDVSATVSYDSGFWSMFFPVRKNLSIGLGLVNSVNVSEFKAVIAHEFGHFSQKSMKLGSYVYNLNRIIYDMVFNNDDYERTLQNWGSSSQYFQIFAELTNGTVRIIQNILKKLYEVINIRYMALSRQMEFHADAVAASVSGSTPLSNALYRLDVADVCYRNVLEYYSTWIQQNRKGLNMYEHHTIAMKHFATRHHLPVKHGLIQVSHSTFEKYRVNKVVIKDQWASHPDVNERKDHLDRLGIASNVVTDSAWVLFRNAGQLQEQLTQELYKNVDFKTEPEIVDNQSFSTTLCGELEKYSFNKEYQGFYDNRNITVFDVETVALEHTDAQNLNDVINEAILRLPFQLEGLNMDIQMLEQLQVKSCQIKSFDFEGKKYDRRDAAEILDSLRKELTLITNDLERADKNIFLLFLKKASLAGDERLALQTYKELFSLFKMSEDQMNNLNSMINEASQLFQRNVTEGMALAVTNNMKRKGDEVKREIQLMLDDSNYDIYYTENEKKTLQLFIDDNRKYFFNNGFDNEAINLFIEAIDTFGRIILNRVFNQKKLALDIQVKVLQGEKLNA